CIVLGRDFKLLDDANILLRTPRQYNMYSIDLNNIVPHRDLTCLVAKASANECNLWHRRLGKQHKASCMSKLVNSISKPLHTLYMDLFGPTFDETSGILREFITKIENLKDLKVKIIRCDNGGEFRNKELNDFCSQEGIKREFSNARTLQQNGVAERRNRSLIEAARTMLADFKLPVTFSAEAVHKEHLESSPSQPQEAGNTDVPESSGNLNPTATSTNPSADPLDTLTVETPIPTASSPVPTVYFSDSQEPSKESNGVEADVSNMETVVIASLTPTLRIHKDHLKSQIIGPVDTPIQTRNKSKEEEGIEYDEVFAPVARIEAIRLFLAYASFMGFTVYQMDVNSVFLYGTIDEKVYVMQPPGFQDPEDPDRVYKVEKAMYGLHQAPRAWYGTLSKYLLSNGFQRGTIDQTLFIRRQKGNFILVQVYVDDIIFRSSNPQLCREFKALMHEKF
nr:putative ribonuclease H-like domain-containing protein [Tanacetum cinerariifolium]